MSLSGRYFASARVPSGSPRPAASNCAGNCRPARKFRPCPLNTPSNRRLNSAMAGQSGSTAMAPKSNSCATSTPPGLVQNEHLLQRRHRVLHMHEEQPAEGEIERRAGHGVELRARRLRSARTGRRLARGDRRAPGAASLPSISMPVTRPCGPTRSAISRITAPGPAPTSRQLMPGLSPTRSSTSSVARRHISA